MFYKAVKAGPKMMNHRRFICEDCENVPDCPQLKDSVWFLFAHPKDLLCIACTERRMGRQIDLSDLRDCVGNAFTFLWHDRVTEAVDDAIVAAIET